MTDGHRLAPGQPRFEFAALVLRATARAVDIAQVHLDARDDITEAAQSLTQFYQQRAQVSAKPGVRTSLRVSVIGDRRTGTLLVAASDEDFAQIQGLAKTFDAPAAASDMIFKVIPLN